MSRTRRQDADRERQGQIPFSLTSPRPTRHRGADTSHAAARAGEERTRELRRRLLEHLRSLPIEQPHATATALHLAVGVPLGVELYEVRRRVSDLRRAGHIADSGHRGTTSTGSPEIAWCAVTSTPYDGGKHL